jgi:hypothetical protein
VRVPREHGRGDRARARVQEVASGLTSCPLTEDGRGQASRFKPSPVRSPRPTAPYRTAAADRGADRIGLGLRS